MSSPFEDESENATLMDNQKKSNEYEDKSFVRRHWPVVLTGAGVIALILIGVAIGAAFNSNSSSVDRLTRDESFPYKDIRLPRNIVPFHYNLFLHPNITDNNNVKRKFNYTGIVRILINVTSKTDNITLHSKGLTITKKKLYSGDTSLQTNQNGGFSEIEFDPTHLHSQKLEILLLKLPENEELDVGKYTLELHFKADISTSLEGFYNSSYKTSSGETRYLATTHFEPTHARAAFPCFDEPALKATFNISIVREAKHKALSNMPIYKNSTRSEDGLIVDHFKKSVKMSTYLVAFVVCDYAFKEKITTSNIRVRVWAPEEQIEQANFAIEVATKVLAYYEEFFNVSFPLPKQDLIAIPDFGAGAMENWGLITYRLTSILYDENESSSANKQWVAVVIAHELAHQWFGNLVTMKWWNDLWLNEGFAAFVEFIGANISNPDWKMMDQFIVDDTQSSLALDSHRNSHPISVPVADPAQINEIFDTISYDKGASIIRMMKDFTGQEAFHTGLTDYLRTYQFRNAESDDLWRCLTKALPSNKHFDVKTVMDTWTLQMGYPVITVTRNENNISLTQKHFLVDSDEDGGEKKLKESKYNYRWHVPITYFTKANKTPKLVWFPIDKEKIQISMPKSTAWYKLNKKQMGFYRVNYDPENWNALREQLLSDHLVLKTSDRANILDDVFELAKAGQADQIDALNMTEYMSKEKEYVPWITFLPSVGYVGEMLRPGEAYKQYYEKYILQQIDPLIKELGWRDEGTHLQKYLRASVLRTAVAHNHTEAVKGAMMLFEDFMVNKKSIPPNLRSAVYLAGIKYGSEKNWNYMFEIFKTTQFPSEQRKIMFALTDTTDKNILKKYLNMALDSSVIRSQDSCSVIEHIALNDKSYQMAYDFVVKNWDELYNRYGKTSFDLSRLIKIVFGKGKTEKELKQAENFFKDKHDKLGSGSLASKQALAAIRNHIRWRATNKEKVTEWLKNKIGATA